MKYTGTLLDEKARNAVYRGVRAIYDPVSRTIGPRPRKALLYRTYNRGSRITDDGVTVAEVQEPRDPYVRLAAATFKEMCKRTAERVGDGTTTTAVIGGKLFFDVYERLLGKGSAFLAHSTSTTAGLCDEILSSAEKVKAAILERKKEVKTLEELEKIAVISAKHEKIGKAVAKLAFEVGPDGHIDVVEGYKGEIETEIMKGMRFNAKVAAKAFVNNPKRYEMIAEDCPVFLTNYALDNGEQIGPALQRFNQNNITKIVVIAPSFSDNVLVAMVKAVKEGGYFIYPVAVPGLRTEQFEDLAVYFNARFFDKNKDMKISSAQKEDLGFVEKLIVKDTDARDEAVAIGGAGLREMKISSPHDGDKIISSAVGERIEMLKSQLKEQKQESFRKLMERRIASLSSGVGVIRVGESVDASALFWKLKIEDCAYACKAALRGGYVKGGGMCLKEIAEELLDEKDVLRAALSHPHGLIQASVPGGIVVSDDVIDPCEAVYWAVEHATKVVTQLIDVAVLTPELDDPTEGEGLMAVSRLAGEAIIAWKRHLGLVREGQEEAERDRLQGLTMDEKVMLDNG